MYPAIEESQSRVDLASAAKAASLASDMASAETRVAKAKVAAILYILLFSFKFM